MSLDDARAQLLGDLTALVGGRVDGAWVQPDTGLIALSVYTGERRVLGVGVGPRVDGLGWLPAPPRFRADVSQPLAAALRAHLVDHRVRGIDIDDEGTLWIIVGGAQVGARVGFVPLRTGEARVIGPAGNLVVRWPVGAEGLGDGSWLERAGDLAASGQALAEKSDGFVFERARAQLAKAVQRRVTQLARRAEAVRGDLARLESVPALQKKGRLLVAQGARIPRGAKRATLEDWEEGGTLDVTLDPAIPAKLQAEALFAKARRIQRGEMAMRTRLAEAERAIDAMGPLRDAVAAIECDSTAYERLASEARALGVKDAPSSVARSGGASKPAARKPFVAYRSAGGHLILVGRGGRDNDTLTTRHARPHDLWLHVKNMPGAHVVVPLEKNTSCPPDLLVDAATLAVHHSDAREEPVADVSYVERRHVRKRKGSAPGLVTLDREKVIVVRMERARLDRLLAAREE